VPASSPVKVIEIGSPPEEAGAPSGDQDADPSRRRGWWRRLIE
jgi:hypothetical protein